jgi:hypothetical protein
VPLCYDVWGLEKEEANPYEYVAENHYTVKKETHVLEAGSVLIWHPHDDERFMNSLEFPPEVLIHKTKKFCRLSYVWRWAHDHGTHFTSGPNDGYAVPDETSVQDLNKIKNAETSSSWYQHLTVENVRDGHLSVGIVQEPYIARAAVYADNYEESPEEEEPEAENINEDDNIKVATIKPPSEDEVKSGSDNKESDEEESHGGGTDNEEPDEESRGKGGGEIESGQNESESKTNNSNEDTYEYGSGEEPSDSDIDDDEQHISYTGNFVCYIFVA